MVKLPLTLVSFCTEATIFIVLMDYDGTLTPIVTNPSQAILSQENFNILYNFLKLCKPYHFSIITGRDYPTLKLLINNDTNNINRLSDNVSNFTVITSHGYRTTHIPSETTTTIKSIKEIKHIKSLLIPYISEFDFTLDNNTVNYKNINLKFEVKDASIAVHYRPIRPEEVQIYKSQIFPQLKECLTKFLEKYNLSDFHLKEGKMVIEVIRKGISKGKAVEALLQQIESQIKTNLIDTKSIRVLCAGDDKTDQDMFDVLKRMEEDAEYKGKLGLDGIEVKSLRIQVGEKDEEESENCKVKSVEEFIKMLEISKQ